MKNHTVSGELKNWRYKNNEAADALSSIAFMVLHVRGISFYVSHEQNGIRLASSIFFTIDDELRGLPPQNSDNQYVREPYVTESSLQDMRTKVNEIAKQHHIKTVYLTWEFYDSKLFVSNRCEIFDTYRVLWGPMPEGWMYWTKTTELTTLPCNTPYLDFTAIKTLRAMPSEPFLLVTTSQWFEQKCLLTLETVFQESGIKIYRSGLQKR